jgi:hypothetical protein
MWCAKPKAESRVAKITVATELVTQRNHPACGYVRNASCSSSANARDTIGTIDLAVERDSIVVAVRYTRGEDRDEHHVGVQIVQIPERIVVDLDATVARSYSALSGGVLGGPLMAQARFRRDAPAIEVGTLSVDSLEGRDPCTEIVDAFADLLFGELLHHFTQEIPSPRDHAEDKPLSLRRKAHSLLPRRIRILDQPDKAERRARHMAQRLGNRRAANLKPVLQPRHNLLAAHLAAAFTRRPNQPYDGGFLARERPPHGILDRHISPVMDGVKEFQQRSGILFCPPRFFPSPGPGNRRACPGERTWRMDEVGVLHCHLFFYRGLGVPVGRTSQLSSATVH